QSPASEPLARPRRRLDVAGVLLEGRLRAAEEQTASAALWLPSARSRRRGEDRGRTPADVRRHNGAGRGSGGETVARRATAGGVTAPSFPNSVWERMAGNSVSCGYTKRSFGQGVPKRSLGTRRKSTG